MALRASLNSNSLKHMLNSGDPNSHPQRFLKFPIIISTNDSTELKRNLRMLKSRLLGTEYCKNSKRYAIAEGLTFTWGQDKL